MKITLTQDAGGHKAGDTINVTTKAAAYLIDAGYADSTEDHTDGTDTPPAKTRRGKAGGASHHESS